jgi:hypothetical protein
LPCSKREEGIEIDLKKKIGSGFQGFDCLYKTNGKSEKKSDMKASSRACWL